MKNHLQQKLNYFLQQNNLKSKNLLVAVSCGVDSMVLFDLLLNQVKKNLIKISVVHVNHGWREESKIEYEFLERYCKEKNIPFYGTCLAIGDNTADKENASRIQRYQFFQKIYDMVEAGGIFVAHHLNDLEETVSKRLFEGAHLSNIGGMRPISYRYNMHVLRPLLSTSKKEIYEYAQAHQVPYFEDQTNNDSQYLRTRLRSEIFYEIFGKNTEGKLAELSTEAWLNHDYFSEKFEQEVKFGFVNDGMCLLNLKDSAHPYEIYNYVILFFKRLNINVSRDITRDLSKVLHQGCDLKKFIQSQVLITASKNICVVECLKTGKDLLDLFPKYHDALSNLPRWVQKLVQSEN